MFRFAEKLLLFALIPTGVIGQIQKLKPTHTTTMTDSGKIIVEIWSDVLCPFCFIGKHKFEEAIEKSPYKNKTTVIWKSFQLDPDIDAATSYPYYEYLSKRKGISIQQTEKMVSNVKTFAKDVNLDLQFDKAIITNSFRAHQFIHLAKKHNKQNEIKEALFQAHFIEGKNISDKVVLTNIGMKNNINSNEIDKLFSENAFTKEVNDDMIEAQELGIQGVPFFVFNRKFAVSGAQDVSVFTKALEQAGKGQ